jgi:hypothetical protein
MYIDLVPHNARESQQGSTRRSADVANLTLFRPGAYCNLKKTARFVAHDFIAHLVLKIVLDNPANASAWSLLQTADTGRSDIHESRAQPGCPAARVKLAA